MNSDDLCVKQNVHLQYDEVDLKTYFKKTTKSPKPQFPKNPLFECRMGGKCGNVRIGIHPSEFGFFVSFLRPFFGQAKRARTAEE
jgi:hypothetical protein